MEDLQLVYSLLSNEIIKTQHRIDRLQRDYWCDVRAEAVAYLHGIHKARDIVLEELHK